MTFPLQLPTFLLHFPEPSRVSSFNSEKSAPSSGTSSYLLQECFSRDEGARRFKQREDMHTVIVDQAALDRHKTFTVLYYVMRKNEQIEKRTNHKIL